MKKRSITNSEKFLIVLILGYFIFMAGALAVLMPFQDGQHSGNRIGAAITANAVRSIGELHRAPSSETALRALRALQTTVTAYQYSAGYAKSDEEDKMLYEMRLLLAKKLVAPPTDNCTDAVECYQMSAPNLTLPTGVVEDVEKAFKNSTVLTATASAHSALLSQISNAPDVYMSTLIKDLILGFLGLLGSAFVFLCGLEFGKKDEGKGTSAEDKPSDTPGSQ